MSPEEAIYRIVFEKKNSSEISLNATPTEVSATEVDEKATASSTAARQGRAGRPRELSGRGDGSQRLPGSENSEQLVRREQGSLQNS